ncbi:hypothetical protein RFI_23430 [Reticulomyxa filosa]|uniref:Uncharacterized protein n=1 Tax=Reticulomyxa filosa TaxID=46433 RepID=X6MIW8_RETFI|nr:hypothetical protein RFI_23430 [Reticulomyxa filosa]|eukprot:ETO13938.1 hypothetical protein RFI_23430 [Reticulomyxa filosa]
MADNEVNIIHRSEVLDYEQKKIYMSVFGFNGVGKTTLINRYVKSEKFDVNEKFDSGVEDMYTKTIIFGEKSKIVVDLHDTGVGTINKNWDKSSCHVVCVVFDLTNEESFQYAFSFPKGTNKN